ncbi:TlpA family protein disulfide reductase [Chryseobacterium sp. KCF3-3]|uniref:TlpA family protein disulfide reductase n=1 Tax=Chryseobacterium sp. KCF3-3 TaxID=3231511 RepID=UPI0038B2C5BE
MKKKIKIIIGIAAVIIATVVFFTMKTLNPDTSLSNLNLKDLSGKQISTKELLNKPLIINYWATWCAPCREELPYFEELSAQYKDKVNIVLISDEDKKVIENFKNKNNYSLNFLVSDKKLDISIRPVTSVYNEKGELVSQKTGAISNDELLEIIKKL